MAIACSEIIQTRDYLFQQFQACTRLKASDMRILVDLVYSINQCSSAISFEEIDLGVNSLNRTISQLVNESLDFTVAPDKLMIFTYTGSDGIVYKYVSALPAGSYGQSNPIFTDNDLILVMKDGYDILDNKIDNLDTDDISEGTTNLYFTDTRVSNSPAVQANTNKVSADGSVTTHNDVTSAGSGAIITSAERSKLAGLESSKFLGNYISLAALQSAHPSPVVGSYGYVDSGIGNDVISYIWDSSDDAYVQQVGTGTSETPATIKTKYESNANTNAFTDAEQTNLSNQSGVNTGDQIASTVSVAFTPTNYSAASQTVEQHLQGIDSALAALIGVSLNFVDYTGSGLVGVQNGTNTTFTVSEGEYLPTILIFVNGQLYWEGNGVTLTDPANGIFDFEAGAEPISTDGVFVYYATTASSQSNTAQWGGISGTLSNQTDLQAELDGKLDITGKAADSNLLDGQDSTVFLQTLSVNGSDLTISNGNTVPLPSGGSNDRANHTGTQTASTISDFDTEVSNNPSVSANTSKVTNQTHSGDITGSTVVTINNDVVTNAKLANMNANTIKGRNSTTGDPQDLTASQVRNILNIEDGANNTILDSVPTNGSTNGVESNGVFDALVDINSYAASNSINADKIVDTSINGFSKIQNASITTDKISPQGTDGQVLTRSGASNVIWATPSSSSVTEESGTYTPTVSASTSDSYTVSSITGNYTKVGGLVNFTISISGLNGSGTGTFGVSLPPFSTTGGFHLFNVLASNFSTGATSIIGESAGTNIFFYVNNSPTAQLNKTFSNTSLKISGVYSTN